jgi:hypothetical protein
MLRRRFNQNANGEYMTLVASEGDTEFAVKKEASEEFNNVQDFYYSINGGEWTNVNLGITGVAIFNVSYGGNIRFKSGTFISTETDPIYFTSNIPFNVTGNIMSLGYLDDAKGKTNLGNNSYACLFNASLVRHVDTNFLPATILNNNCYANMFLNCSYLESVPDLPATKLYQRCYSSMFQNCTSLIVAPELPATTLASYCYSSMFQNCTSLIVAPELPATTLASYCYSSMFRGCTSLTTPPNLPATTLADGCYDSMFSSCSKLTTAPELPATTLADGCYDSMFSSCSKLTTAPELPATTLTYSCYNCMFYNCSKLGYIKMLATNISASSCLSNWVYGVSSKGTFVKNPSMTSLPTGNSGIPSGWTVVNDGEE